MTRPVKLTDIHASCSPPRRSGTLAACCLRSRRWAGHRIFKGKRGDATCYAILKTASA
jgi:hypothetical protein